MLHFIARIKSPKSIFTKSRATYIRGFWPEPITLPSLQDFLRDINYFEEPKKFVNIGLKNVHEDQPTSTKDVNPDLKNESIINDLTPELVDTFLDKLSKEEPLPPLDYDDVTLQGEKLVDLAITSGIYRDLFGRYQPNTNDVFFTRDQAEKMKRFVPSYWITDQPLARVCDNPQEPDPILYFEPVIGISAKFVNDSSANQSSDCEQDLHAHTSYYGNFIPASQALVKPSITIDGCLLNSNLGDKVITEKQFTNWVPGRVESVNFDSSFNKFLTVLLLNLDYVHDNSTNLHWAVSNVKPSSDGPRELKYQEVCEYLPVHGINGMGASRYVFLALQHDSELNLDTIGKFTPEERKFDLKSFIESHQDKNIIPVGLSWFQTNWDESSNKIFHDYLQMKAPVYEHVQTKLDKLPQAAYPGIVPFNIYLDHNRSKKSINEQVLLERLKSVKPFDYADQYVPPRVPPTVFEDDPKTPSWMTNVSFKKKNKIGYWRGLRPASAILPLNNNVDLDYPIRPKESITKSPPENPNLYKPKMKIRPRASLPHYQPGNETRSVYVQEDHEIHLQEVEEMVKRMKENSTNQSRVSQTK